MSTLSSAPSTGRRDVSSPCSYREGRRLRAAELFEQGWKQREIAQALGVTEGAVSQWINRFREAGKASLKQHASPGRPPGLSPEQIAQLEGLLRQGAESFGFTGAVWTCARVASVIERYFGISYHPAHVSRMLHQRLHWSLQKPVPKATQRNEEAIARWRKREWPRLKRGR